MQAFIVSRTTALAFAVILAFGVWLRWPGMTLSFWNDEIASIMLAKAGSTLDVIGETARRDSHPPLFYMLLHIWMQISASEVWLRLLPLAANLVTIGLLARIIWFCTTDKVLTLGMAMLATVSFSFCWVSSELRNYSLQVLFSTLTIYLGLRATESQSRREWFALGAATALSWYSFYYALYASIGLFVALLLLKPNLRQLKGLAIAGLTALFLFAPWLPNFYLQTQRYAFNRVAGPPGGTELWRQIPFHLTVNGPLSGIADILIESATPRGPEYIPTGITVLTLLIVAAFSKHIPLVKGRPQATYLSFFAQLALCFMAFVVIGGASNVYLSDRYTVFLLVPLLALLVLASGLLPGKRALAIIAVFVALQTTQATVRMNTAAKQEWRGAAAYLDTILRPGDRIGILADFTKPNLLFYLKSEAEVYAIPKDIVPPGKKFSGHKLTRELLPELDNTILQGSRLIMVWSHALQPKDRGYKLLREYLVLRAWKMVGERDFKGVRFEIFEPGAHP